MAETASGLLVLVSAAVVELWPVGTTMAELRASRCARLAGR